MKNKLLLLFSIIIVFLCVFSIRQCTRGDALESEMRVKDYNAGVLADSMHTIQLANDELAYSRSSLIASRDSALGYLDLEKSKVLELESQLGSMLERAAAIEAGIKLDTIYIKGEISSEDSMRIALSYLNEWITMGAHFDFRDSALVIDSLRINVPLTVGYTRDYQFTITSPNPYLQFTDIKSSLIGIPEDKKKQRRLGISLNAGPGIYYGLTSKMIDLGLGVNVGLAWRLL